MSYDLTKRISQLKDQVNADNVGRLSPPSVFFQTFVALAVIAFFVSQFRSPEELRNGGMAPEVAKRYSNWQKQTKLLVEERRDYLLDSFFGETRANLYLQFSNNVMELFGVSEPSTLSDKGKLLDLDSWGAWFSECCAGLLLRACFIIFACVHLWVLGIIGGYLAFRHLMIPQRTKDFLGILDRGKSPFYSGIFGPLRPNKSISGTDLACPSLACPLMAPRKEATNHPIFWILKKYGAINETNTRLAQIILAYRDYPAVVEEERKIEDQDEEGDIPNIPDPTSSFLTNEEGTIETSSKQLLEAVLCAHQLIKKEFHSNSKKNSDYKANRERLISLSQKINPLASRLILALTPTRAESLSKLPTTAVASAYLSLEAGKSLLFRKEGEAYFQISRFPNLQARAVLQSVVSYHEEYNGDLRLTIRQAIVTSRRHGDFGRAILPVNMSVASRALRDWLEILGSSPKKRDGFADLVELDANLEELHQDFRKEFIRRLLSASLTEKAQKEIPRLKSLLWKGLYYKSVVLFPLKNLFDIVLNGTDKFRLDRIGELLQATRRLQSGLSISARLPGFKRQAEEAGKDANESGGITSALNKDPKNKELLEGWLIIRRMLIRYNWLSTRVGDSAVPVDGLIQAVVLDRSAGERPEVLGLDVLVPLRQRQFKELLGIKWAEQYYQYQPSGNDIDIYEEIEDYKDGLKEVRENAAKGLFDKPLREANKI